MAVEDAFVQSVEESLHVIVLMQGVLTDGSAHYAYIAIPGTLYTAFKEAERQGNCTPEKYGMILAHGAGLHPPVDIVQRMRHEYGATHRFEEDFLEALNHTGA